MGHIIKFAVIVWFLFISALCYYDENEKKPLVLTAAVGNWVVFDCELDFPQNMPIPYLLNWKKQGEVIFSARDGQFQIMEPYKGRMQLLDDPYPHYGRASVNLSEIREDDTGSYECQVWFPNRTPPSTNNGTWFFLTVNGGNLLAALPLNKTVLEGSEVEFACAKKDPSTIINWYKDKIPIAELPDILHRSWISEEGNLTIRPTAMGDMGEFECRARNTIDEEQSVTAFLNVQYKAKVIYAPREVHLPYGRSAILDCHFRANPPLKNLRWEKDGFLFDPYNVQGVLYRRNGSLFFSKVDESHNGYYTCTPFNDLGTDGPSPSIHVIVQRPPIFVIIPRSIYRKKLGDSVEIPCDARDGEENHKPIIVWYKKDGSSLPIGRYSIRDGNLTIINIREEDRGFYQCSATNEAATITAETELFVENAPVKAPHNLTALAYTSSVHLSWMASVRRPSTEYSVWYKPVDIVEWKTMRISSKKYLEATISNLNPGREYEFMVFSKDDQGDGLFSKPIRVWTKGINPETSQIAHHIGQKLGPPEDVRVHATQDGYLVTWNPPQLGLEEWRIYIVRWFQGPKEHLVGTAETKNTSYLINDLEEGFDYTFQVVAMSFSDYQIASEKVAFKVPPYRRIRSVSIGLVTGIAFVAVIVLGVYFVKKKFCGPFGSNNGKRSI